MLINLVPSNQEIANPKMAAEFVQLIEILVMW
jgi:hypothetical protein